MSAQGWPSRDAGVPAAAGPVRRYAGRTVYLFAFDLAYDMRRQRLDTLLGQPVEHFAIDPDKRSPREAFFFRPQMVRLPPVERAPAARLLGGDAAAVRLERTVKLFPVGAVSLTFAVSFRGCALEDLVAYHDLRFEGGTLAEEARHLAQRVRAELAPILIRPVAQVKDEEAYTVFCLDPALGREGPAEGAPPAGEGAAAETAEAWLGRQRRQVAALLTQEEDPQALSTQEVAETTSHWLSYYGHDLVVADWDAALVVEEPRLVAEVLHVVELANVQLAELEAYDRLLDAAVDRSYADLSGREWRGVRSLTAFRGWWGRGRAQRQVVRGLREIRVDLARLDDELSNLTKFFGDWHLARVYRALAARFHLGDWQHTIADKLRTLDSLYQILRQDQTNHWMMVLEVAIVLLFVIDLVVLIVLRP